MPIKKFNIRFLLHILKIITKKTVQTHPKISIQQFNSLSDYIHKNINEVISSI